MCIYKPVRVDSSSVAPVHMHTSRTSDRNREGSLDSI